MLKKILLLVCSLLVVAQAEAGTITRPGKTFGGSVFVNGVVPQASDFNGDHDTMYSEFNGNITNANIHASAAISPSKINPDGFTANIRTVTTNPCDVLDESDQAGDAKRWAVCVINGVLSIVTHSDAGAVQNTWFQINRSNGGITMGGVSGTNTITGPTTFNQLVTFSSGTSLTPTGMVAMYMGSVAPSGWLNLDGSTNSCTGASSANAALCTQLVAILSAYKGAVAATVTLDTASNEVIHAGHGKSVNDRVHFSVSGGSLGSPLASTTVYCIISTTTDRFKISTTCGGGEVDITTAGSGTQSDHFNFVVPDARGRNPVGSGAGPGLTNRSLGSTGGEETHLITSAESGVAPHTHPITDPGHSHTMVGGTGSSSASANYAVGGAVFSATQNDSTSTNSTGITQANNPTGASASNSHNVMDPYIAMMYIIKL